jgi:hypothetical protein
VRARVREPDVELVLVLVFEPARVTELMWPGPARMIAPLALLAVPLSPAFELELAGGVADRSRRVGA